jgi:predicted enzyme related to lactoylglutathione lyase
MAYSPDPFGIAVTVDDIGAAQRFYSELYPHDRIAEGVFAGISYISIMRDGETLVNVFQKGVGNPLAAMFPILKVESVAESLDTVTRLGGQVLIPASVCPCNGSAFAVCIDATGSQFMVKEPCMAG